MASELQYGNAIPLAILEDSNRYGNVLRLPYTVTVTGQALNAARFWRRAIYCTRLFPDPSLSFIQL